MNWSDATDAQITEMFHRPMSYSQIASEFKGATVGMVAGKCRRLGLRREGKVIVLKLPNPKPAPVRLVALAAKDCRWPIGDPKSKDFAFCGRDAKPGSPYCSEHEAKARVKNSRRHGGHQDASE